MAEGVHSTLADALGWGEPLFGRSLARIPDPDIYPGIQWRCPVSSRAQKRAIETYRSRLTERGIVRFELQARKADRELIRKLVRKLIEEGPEAGRIRRALHLAVSGESRRQGGILAALRRSPLVGAELDLTRPREEGRKVEL
jgi:hypothetical protein